MEAVGIAAMAFTVKEGEEVIIGRPEIGRVILKKIVGRKRAVVCLIFPKDVRVDRKAVRDKMEAQP